MDDMVVKMWRIKDYQADTVVWLSRKFSIVLQTFWSFLYIFHYSCCSPDLTYSTLLLFKNTKRVIDNDCHCDPMWSCCKAGVILITYSSRHAKRHGSPKAAGMRCEPSCLMANAPLWSAGVWGGCLPYETLLHEDHGGFMPCDSYDGGTDLARC